MNPGIGVGRSEATSLCGTDVKDRSSVESTPEPEDASRCGCRGRIAAETKVDFTRFFKLIDFDPLVFCVSLLDRAGAEDD